VPSSRVLRTVPGRHCQLITDSGRPQLCSAHTNALTVLRTNTRLANRSFWVVGPRIWNSLPASLRQPDIEFEHFKRLLKAFLFGDWDCGTLVTLWFQCTVYKSIYLLTSSFSVVVPVPRNTRVIEMSYHVSRGTLNPGSLPAVISTMLCQPYANATTSRPPTAIVTRRDSEFRPEHWHFADDWRWLDKPTDRWTLDKCSCLWVTIQLQHS